MTTTTTTTTTTINRTEVGGLEMVPIRFADDESSPSTAIDTAAAMAAATASSAAKHVSADCEDGSSVKSGSGRSEGREMTLDEPLDESSTVWPLQLARQSASLLLGSWGGGAEQASGGGGENDDEVHDDGTATTDASQANANKPGSDVEVDLEAQGGEEESGAVEADPIHSQ